MPTAIAVDSTRVYWTNDCTSGVCDAVMAVPRGGEPW